MKANKYKVMVICHIALKTDSPHPNMTKLVVFSIISTIRNLIALVCTIKYIRKLIVLTLIDLCVTEIIHY
jgi:hypothetical protein